MAELRFFTGTMDSGKSTLAMQIDYNYASNGRRGLVFTTQDRSGAGQISSRIGLSTPATEVDADFDFLDYVLGWLATEKIEYLVCDEAQFYTPAQIDQLARLVDDYGINVFAFGITTDFRSQLFPGSARLIELADHVEWLQLQTLCWCGARATHQARKLDGEMVVDGAQVLRGDTDNAEISYEVLCRRHHMRHEVAPR